MNVFRCSRAGLPIRVALGALLLSIHPMAWGPTVSNAGQPNLTPAARPTLPNEVAGITSPYRTATLAALRPSRIIRLEVTEGQVVQRGELLAVLDDGVQRVRAETAKADAESLLDIELARTRMRQASADLKRLRHLNIEASATDRELGKSETEAETARLVHEVAKFEHQQAAREYRHQQLMLERLHVRAPFSGYIAEVFREIGETVTEAEAILRIVQLDHLEISVDCPLEMAHAVRVGESVHVRPTDPQWEPRNGQIVFASRVADAGSQTFKVKLVVDNGDAGWRSGLKVLVDFASSVPEENVRIGGASLTRAAAEKAPAQRSSERQHSD